MDTLFLTWTAELMQAIQAKVKRWWTDTFDISGSIAPHCASKLTDPPVIFCVLYNSPQRDSSTLLSPSLTILCLELTAA